MKKLTKAELLTLITKDVEKVLPSQILRTLLAVHKELTFAQVFSAIQLVVMQKILEEEHEKTY